MKDNLKKIKTWLWVFLQAGAISTIVIVSVLPVSCKITAAGIEVVGGDYTAPVLQNVEIISEKELKLVFSEKVNIKQAVVSPVLSGISDSEEVSKSVDLSLAISSAIGRFGAIQVESLISEDGTEIIFELAENTIIGKDYELYGVVEDAIGNSLIFCVPFNGFNSSVPDLIMTELHTAMATQLNSEEKTNTRRLEFVEFLALTDGNLSGLEFCSGFYGENRKYVFPSIEVHKGEIFVLHLRVWGDGCISEEGEDLTLSKATYSGDNYRDLWVSSSQKVIGDTTDILILRNSVNNKILDAVMYRAVDVDDWAGKLKIDYSVYSGISDIYPSGDIENATVSNGLSSTKFLRRVDGKEIFKMLTEDEEIEYPVKVDADSWEIVSTATAGSL